MAVFALNDIGAFREICGANDCNLTLFEQLFETAVYARSSELVLESTDHAIQRDFSSLCKELVSYLNVGYEITLPLIRSLYEQICEGNPSFTKKEHVISLPIGASRIVSVTKNQYYFMQAMRTMPITFGVGPAGTGKTFLSVAFALGEYFSKKKEKIILTRPVVEVGESLGYLPGDMSEKLAPYLRPLFDVIRSVLPDDLVEKITEQNIIEISPLAYMRGRDLKNSFIILDEAQNTTKEQMKMFLTRLGTNSTCVVTGDPTQVDRLPKHHSGLLHAVKVLKGVEGIQVVYLHATDIVRSTFVQSIVRAYEQAE